MEKRDLKVDLGIARGMKPLNTSEYYEGISLETAQQYMMAAEGWPHAIERAIEAEALVREYEEIGFTPEEVMDVVRRFTSFLCEVTGGQMSKPNYTLKDMVAVADDYYQRICDESLQEEIERANKVESLNRELVAALEIAYDAMYLDIMNAHDYPNCERKVKKVLAKAKEVLDHEKA